MQPKSACRWVDKTLLHEAISSYSVDNFVATQFARESFNCYTPCDDDVWLCFYLNKRSMKKNRVPLCLEPSNQNQIAVSQKLRYIKLVVGDELAL